MSLSNISIKTLNMLDKATLECKKEVIKDVYTNYLQDTDITLEQMIESLIKREQPPKRKLIKRPRTITEYCYAKVWDSKLKKYHRCKFNKLENSDFCGLHKNKQNYGNI
jgi:hypothetical protein